MSSLYTNRDDEPTKHVLTETTPDRVNLSGHDTPTQGPGSEDPRSSTESASAVENLRGGAVGAPPPEAYHAAHPAIPGEGPRNKALAPKGHLSVHFGIAHDQGQREYQQDRYTLVRDLAPDPAADWAHKAVPDVPRSFLAVFDGHKRCESADMASKRMAPMLAREPAIFGAVAPTGGRDPIFEAIKRTFSALDEEIIHVAEHSNVQDCQFGGTTALIALLIGQVLYVAHAGDSGAVMACTSFSLSFPLRLTADHKPNRPDEHARIQQAGGDIDEAKDRVVSEPKPHNNRVTLLNMSRALGDAQFKMAKGKEGNLVECTPEVRRIELQRGDAGLILASDGLWDVLSDSAAVRVLDQVREDVGTIDDQAATAAAQALVDEALHRGTADNVTALVMLLDWS